MLNQLFKMTQLQETFHVNMLALVDGILPRVLTLKNILEEYLKHRQTVVRRRTEYDLARAKERAHILEGLRIALFKIDEVIATIKKSKDKDEAKINLIKKFKLSEIQAGAILEMRLQQLANLERLRVEQEYKEKMKLIKELESILKSAKKMLEHHQRRSRGLGGEIRRRAPHPGRQIAGRRIRQRGSDPGRGDRRHADRRRLHQAPAAGHVPHPRHAAARASSVSRPRKKTRSNICFSTNTHADMMFFTTRGRVFQLKAYDVPQGSRTAKGQAIVNFLQLAPGEKVATVLPMGDMDGAKISGHGHEPGHDQEDCSSRSSRTSGAPGSSR